MSYKGISKCLKKKKKQLSFRIGVKLISNVIVLGVQPSDSATHTHASILSQTPLPSRLPHSTEQSPYAVQ